MRDYAIVSPRFWIGETGQFLREAGPITQLVCLYLLTSPHSNMFGLYYLPFSYIVEDIGSPSEALREGLERARQGGFCAYNEQKKVVFVYNMAEYQIAQNLKANDNRIIKIKKDFKKLYSFPYVVDFYNKYKDLLHLDPLPDYVLNNQNSEGLVKGLASPPQGGGGGLHTGSGSGIKDLKDLVPSSKNEQEKIEEKIPKIPLQDGTEFLITSADLEEFKNLYPAVNVLQELSAIRGWNLSRPKEQKTQRGILKHINQWLRKEQKKLSGSPQNKFYKKNITEENASVVEQALQSSKDAEQSDEQKKIWDDESC